MKAEKCEILNSIRSNGDLDKLTNYASYVDCVFPDNGTDYNNSIVLEDEESWFIDLGIGAGFAQYNKCDFTLKKALKDAITNPEQ